MNSYGTPSIEIRAFKPVSVIKIGWIAPENWLAAQTRIRVLRVNKCLRSMGYQSFIVQDAQEIIDKNYDIAIIGKSFDESSYNSIKLLKQHNKKVICDICEDVIGWPWVNEILRDSDKIVCCSYKLEEKVKTVNMNTIVIEDAFEI